MSNPNVSLTSQILTTINPIVNVTDVNFTNNVITLGYNLTWNNNSNNNNVLEFTVHKSNDDITAAKNFVHLLTEILNTKDNVNIELKVFTINKEKLKGEKDFGISIYFVYNCTLIMYEFHLDSFVCRPIELSANTKLLLVIAPQVFNFDHCEQHFISNVKYSINEDSGYLTFYINGKEDESIDLIYRYNDSAYTKLYKDRLKNICNILNTKLKNC